MLITIRSLPAANTSLASWGTTWPPAVSTINVERLINSAGPR